MILVMALARPPLRDQTQRRRIPERLGQRDVRRDHPQVPAVVHVRHLPPPRADVAQHVPEELIRHTERVRAPGASKRSVYWHSPVKRSLVG